MRRWWLIGILACDAPAVTMTIDLPSSVQADTAWIELGAFKGSCPSTDQLAGGLPPSGFTARVAFTPSDPPPALGKIDTATYGFAAVARRTDCGVLATGCATANVAEERSVSVSLDPTADPTAGACSAGLVCNEARCVPPSSGADPAAGAGCSMKLIGAGPLPDSLTGGPLVSAPAITATTNGFLIAYAEYLDTDGTERVTVQFIDAGGGAAQPSQATLDGHCPGQTKMDAAAIAMGSSGGLVVLSRPPCQGQSGLELLPIDASGTVQKRNLFLNASAPDIALSVHALTPAAASGKYLVAVDTSSAASLLSTDGASVATQVTTSFATAQDTSVRAVRSAKLLAVEADGPSVGDAGLSGSVARLYLVAGSSDPSSLGAPVDQVAANLTALTVLDNRAFLLTDSPGKGEDVLFRGYDLGAKNLVPVVSGGATALKQAAVLALDAAAAQNRLFAAIEQQDSIGIAVIDGASSASPTFLRRVDFVTDDRIPSTAHDGPIAIAATGTAIGVAWVARKTALADGDPVGGYAIFACSP